MSLRVAINGFGRIGRCLTRIILDSKNIELVAINITSDNKMALNLLKYDSVHRTFEKDMSIKNGYLFVDDKKIKLFSTRNHKELDFFKYGADIVFECTGKILTKKDAMAYIDKNIKTVIMSAPSKDVDVPMFVMGVNERMYKGEEIISNASCTTNSLAPIIKLIHEGFTVKSALVSSIHSYTNDQKILDNRHHKDLRRARAAALNIIPTTTGAAKSIGLIIPSLSGCIHGVALRVPTPNVSLIDVTALVGTKVNKDDINNLFLRASSTSMKNILGVDENYRVSQDFVGSKESSVVISDLTQVINSELVKIMAWYDNEWGYSVRLTELAQYVYKYNKMRIA